MIEKILAHKKFIIAYLLLITICSIQSPCNCGSNSTEPTDPPGGNSTARCLFTESYDGGQTWSTPDTLDKIMRTIYCGALNGGSGVYLLGGEDTSGTGTIWRSTDQGHTFQTCYTLPSTDPKSMYNFGSNIFVVNFDGSYLKSSNSGSTWTLTGTSSHAECMAMTGPTLLLGTSDGRIMMSYDNGLSWTNTYYNPSGHIYEIASAGGSAIACDLPLVICTSSAGQSWDSVLYTSNNFLNVRASLHSSGSGILISNSDVIFYRTHDHGQTFASDTLSVPSNLEFNDICMTSQIYLLAATSDGLKYSTAPQFWGGLWPDLFLDGNSIYQINRNGEDQYIFVVGK